ncbi:hypothetical protein D3Y59_11165 [Hymenobacter oligotrophus]|uniref:Uncharacterized protein n=1 Tax=Hymenobacter oligotrophus TaxID=2319843 RepID=A0A3B7QWQ9_9BACT|nr:hypothetical protein [Hymenobacter oligotrophus]AYA37558.1 hypothetical protein D3Y59_11165 [Hymenobacter oligotrophus]
MKNWFAFLPLLAAFGCSTPELPQPQPGGALEQSQVYSISYSKQAANGQPVQLDDARIEVYTAEPEASNGTFTLKPYALRTTYTNASASPVLIDLPAVTTYAGGPAAKLRLVLSSSARPAAGQVLDVHVYQGRTEVFAAQHTGASAQQNGSRYETIADYSIAPL